MMATKRERAIELRDIALPIIKARGTWHETQPGWPNLLGFGDDALKIAFRSPFQKLPPPSGELVHKAITYGVTLPQSLPYGLDIWARTKVLNIEWSDDGDVAVLSYKVGSWEQELKKLAASL